MASQEKTVDTNIPAMKSRQTQRKVDQILTELGMPDYVVDYMHSGMAPTTQRTRLPAIKLFFQWLIDNKITSATTFSGITLEELAKAKSSHLTAFWRWISDSPADSPHNTKVFANIAKAKTDDERENWRSQIQKRKQGTTDGIITTLSSLNRWLAKQFHLLDKDGIPESQNKYLLFRENRWADIDAPDGRETVDLSTSNDGLLDKMYTGKEFEELLRFIKEDYPYKSDSNLKTKNDKDTFFYQEYKRNLDRDLLIFVLMKWRGMRISEILNLTISQIDMQHKMIKSVYRKNKKIQTLPFSDEFIPYFENYLNSRNKNYPEANMHESERAFLKDTLFLSMHGNRVRQLSRSAAEKMVLRYTKVQGRPTHPHAFRHAFATDAVRDGKTSIVTLQHGLGHSSISTTQRYVQTDEDQDREMVANQSTINDTRQNISSDSSVEQLLTVIENLQKTNQELAESNEELKEQLAQFIQSH